MQPLGDGLVRPGSYNILVSDVDVDTSGNAYVVGSFIYGGGIKLIHIGKWDRSAGKWQPLGDGVDSYAGEVLVNGDTVYVAASNLTSASGLPVNQIAMWDGTQWLAMDEGVPGANILDMVLDNFGNLYVCGSSLDSAGTVSVSGVAMWNGSQWEAVGVPLGVNGAQLYIFDMYLDSLTNYLYVCGQVDYISNPFEYSYGVVMWDGVKWNESGAEYLRDKGTPRAITRNGEGDLIVAGNYGSNELFVETNVGVSGWGAYIGGAVGGTVTALLTVGCDMYISGDPIFQWGQPMLEILPVGMEQNGLILIPGLIDRYSLWIIMSNLFM